MLFRCSYCGRLSLVCNLNRCQRCWAELFPFGNVTDGDLYTVIDLDDGGGYANNINTSLNNTVDDLVDYPSFPHTDHKSKYFLPEELLASYSVHNAQKHYSILNLNCRSLGSSFDKICVLLTNLDFIKFDIIVLTETWTTNQTNNNALYHLDNYSAFFQGREKKRGGGVAVFVKKVFTPKLLDEKWATCVHLDNVELLTLIIGHGHNQIYLTALYRPPSGNFEDFVLTLDQSITKLSCKNYFLAGDFNLNLLDIHHDTKVQRFYDLMVTNGLFPLISRPTRITNNSETLIDNIFTNQKHRIICNGILICNISDHLPVFSMGNMFSNYERVKKVKNVERVLTNSGINQMKTKLLEIDWASVLNEGDLDVKVQNFYDIYNNIYRSAHTLKIIDQKVNTGYKPWITLGIMKSSSTKNKLYKKLIASKQKIPDNQYDRLQEEYKQYKALFNKMYRKAKKEYFVNEFDRLGNDSRKSWKLINSFFKGNQKEPLPQSMYLNKNEYKNEQQISEAFNHYFSTIGSSLAQKIPSNNESILKCMPPAIANSMYLSEITEVEITNIVKQFKPSRSVGHDDMNVLLLKCIITSLSKPLAVLFNHSFQLGTVPKLFKIGKIVPVHKNKDKSNIANYRPITLLVQVSKILERCFYNRLIKFIDVTQILHKRQYGFRSKHSTSHAVVDVINYIQSALSDHHIPVGLFIDFSKAFDTVNHKILLKKLSIYGIRGLAHEWLISYLSDRFQYTVIKNDKGENFQSSYAPSDIGVPQGSVLGSILFILYINDMPNVDKNLQCILFADDTTILCRSDNSDSLNTLLNTGIEKLTAWFNANQLSLNVDKTVLMIFGKTEKKINIQKNLIDIKIGDKKIPFSDTVKFLGIHIDPYLKWSVHCNKLRTKISQAIGIIRKIKKFLSKKVLLKMYMAFINSHLSYCTEIWGFGLKTDINKIIGIQKRALKIICSNVNFKKLNILPVDSYIKFRVLKLMHCVKFNLAPISMSDIFLKHSHALNTRHANDFLVRRLLCRDSVVLKGPTFYNNLISNLRNEPNVHVFSRKLKIALFENIN